MPRLVAVLIGIWGTAVGMTRVYLGVLWFSDVRRLAVRYRLAGPDSRRLPAGHAGGRGVTSGRILVVEDDHALRDLLLLLRGLREEGFDLAPAQDGASALRLAGEGFDALVLDVGLPDADGRDVCQALRPNGYLAPVVFLTAHHMITDRLSGFPAGGEHQAVKLHTTLMFSCSRSFLEGDSPRPVGSRLVQGP